MELFDYVSKVMEFQLYYSRTLEKLKELYGYNNSVYEEKKDELECLMYDVALELEKKFGKHNGIATYTAILDYPCRLVELERNYKKLTN